METVLMLCCIIGLAWFVQHHDGPFNLLSMARQLLMKIPVIGPFVQDLLGCNFCSGALSGASVYLVTTGLGSLSLADLFVWTFGSGMVNRLASSFVSNLERQA